MSFVARFANNTSLTHCIVMPGRVRQPSSKLAFLEASSNEWQEHQDHLDATKAERKRTKKSKFVFPVCLPPFCQSCISHVYTMSWSSFSFRADRSSKGSDEFWTH